METWEKRNKDKIERWERMRRQKRGWERDGDIGEEEEREKRWGKVCRGRETGYLKVLTEKM